MSSRPPGVQVSYRRQYRRCGKAGCTRCAAGGPGHGPYWYAYWWEDGRAHSRYLGKQPPPGVALTDAPPQAVKTPASAPSTAVALRVRTLGGLMVWRGATALGPEQWRSQRAATLFKCLLSVPGQRLSREQASELLWPEGAPVAVAGNLRTTLHLLRQVLDGPGAPRAAGDSHLRTEGALLVLAPAGAADPADDWLDATAFAHAAQAALAGPAVAPCRAALALYGGDYLPDDVYADWAAAPRAALRQQYLALLLHLASVSGAQGDLEESEDCLRRVVATEPGHEEAAATLMRLLAESGRRGEALRVYQALATVLEQELDVAPTAELAALRARLLAQDAAPRATHIPARPAAPRLSNLPAALTSFVGRSWELAEVAEIVATTRLLTLVGPGGCGKTRLALEVAERLVDTDAYPDGVWLVELAALADPALVPQVIATTLGVAEQTGEPMHETLAAFLQPRRTLLILDNCEHLRDACAALATTLLQGCPQVQLLTTSREGLGVAGEQLYLVPSLAAPDPAHLPPLEGLGTYEAVTLFLERARARQPAFTLTAANVETVTQICARLDGLPLAIELAAARVGVLPVEVIAARLDDRFRLLTGGPRTALPRQQTLGAAITWSYDLLSVPEQVLLRRLAVFAGGWTLDAAEAICAETAVPAGGRSTVVDLQGATPDGNARVPTALVLDLLTALVHKSLVVVAEREGEGRYGLLETIRAFARERLSPGGERELVQRQHARYYLALAEGAEAELRGPAQVAWLARLEREQDNLRAALRAACEGGELELGLRLAGAVWRFWYVRGHLSEGRRWLDEALTSWGDAGAAPVRAKALWGAATLAWSQGDNQAAARMYEASEALYRQLGDVQGLVGVLLMRGWVCDAAQRAALAEESVALSRETAYKHGLADALATLGIVARGEGDLLRACALGEESLALARELGDVHRIAAVLLNLAEVAFAQGAYRRAAALLDDSLRLWREQGSKGGTAHALDLLAQVRQAQGDHREAVALLHESLALWRDQGAATGAAHTLALLRRVEQGQARHPAGRAERDR